MTRFSKLVFDDQGNPVEIEVREITQSAVQRCPHFILMADHYRDDNTCRCNDKTNTIMKEWGYKWSKGMWR